MTNNTTAGRIPNVNQNEIFKSVLSILTFLVGFFVLISSVIVLSGLLFFWGINLIFKKYLLFTIPLGISFTVVALMQMVFIANFLFSAKKRTTQDLKEIDEFTQPGLFRFIVAAAYEAKVRLPKKIFLSSDANAYVFYDLSIWHLFFPPKKNLCIGIGLINVLNQAELRCILAHEFGHFKQNSIKIESFVNRTNQIIHNLLFEQVKLEKTRSFLPKTYPNFVYYVQYGNFLISLIEDVLRWLFIKINTHHFSLKRTLEFDADRFSSKVFGSERMIKALTMLKYGAFALDEVLRFYCSKSEIQTADLYSQQFYLFNNLILQHTLPADVTRFDYTPNFNCNNPFSEIKFHDPFASHPPILDRIAYLQELNFPNRKPGDLLARDLLSDKNKIFEYFSEEIFKEIGFDNKPKILSQVEFEKEYYEIEKSMSFGEPFGKFYTYYSPDFSQIDTNYSSVFEINMDTLFSAENQKKSLEYNVLKEDLAVVRKISKGEISADFFEFKGLSYYKNQTLEIENEIVKGITALENEFKIVDKNALKYFENEAKKQYKLNELETLLKRYQMAFLQFHENQNLLQEMYKGSDFINLNAPPDIILIKLKAFKKLEETFKSAIKKSIDTMEKDDILSPGNLQIFEKYLNKDLSYFSGINYNEKDIRVLFQIFTEFENLSMLKFHFHKKQLLQFFSALYIFNTSNLVSGQVLK